jgi:hypothetical protein
MKILNKKRLLISSIVVLGAILLTIFLIHRIHVEVINENISFDGINVNPPMPGGICADYNYYKNYDQVDDVADTVVIGDVIKVNEPEKVVVGETTNTITGEIEQNTHIYVFSEVKVSKVIKGKYLPGDIIKIAQFTGPYKEVGYDEHNMYGIMYYQKGERYIFFLSRYEDGTCSTVNPQQGDMLIEDGKTSARNKVQFIKENVSEALVEKALKERVEALKAKENKDSK